MSKQAPLTQEGGSLIQDTATVGTPSSNSVIQNASAPRGDIAAAQTLLELEQYMYMQYIYFSGFDWKTTDNPGTKLFEVKMHPSSNKITAFLSQIFNAWEGGIDVQTNIAGTGFNGGKILIAFLPPNIDDKMFTLSDYTFFPYCLIDPKAQGAVNHPGADWRSTYFHIMEEFTQSRFGIINSNGGRMVFVVYQRLTIANQQNQLINIAVNTRPSADFMFAQPIPPRISKVPKSQGVDLVHGYQDPLNPIATYTNIFFSDKKTEGYLGVDFLVPVRGEPKLPRDWHFQGRTAEVVTTNPNAKKFNNLNVFESGSGRYIEIDVSNQSSTKHVPRLIVGVSSDADPASGNTIGAFAATSATGCASVMYAFSAAGDVLCASCDSGLGAGPGLAYGFCGDACMKYDEEYNKYASAVGANIKTSNNEFIVYFTKGTPLTAITFGSVITNELRQQMLLRPFANLGSDDTPLFDLKEIDTGITLARLRLNRDGFLSSLTKKVVVPIGVVKLVYFGFIKYYERIPDSGVNPLAARVVGRAG